MKDKFWMLRGDVQPPLAWQQQGCSHLVIYRQGVAVAAAFVCIGSHESWQGQFWCPQDSVLDTLGRSNIMCL